MAFWANFLAFLEKDQKKIPVLYSLLKQVSPIEIAENKIVLGCYNQGLMFFLEKRLREIELALFSFGGKKTSVELVLSPLKKKNKETPLLTFQPSINDLYLRAGLRSKYSFENFAVSSTNQVAFAACQAVTNNLGKAYNPLFLYGGVGVGKTHLAQAVGRKVLDNDQNKKVFFCPGDLFTNELIESIQNKSTQKFRRRYRYLDLFIVDDIQFISGKKAVQEEFFHTFNSIVSAGGQIILTSDRPPFEIKELEDRLRSRFSGGLTVDIQPPDFELRTAILLIKAKEKNIDINIEEAKVIAEQVSDARALEGTLLSLYARSLEREGVIDLNLIAQYFSQKNDSLMRKITPVAVLKTVCSAYNIRLSHLRGESRSSRFVLPRQIAMYILRNHLRLKLEEISLILKKKDHTTVIHAVEKIDRLLMKNPLFKQEVDRIIKLLDLST